MLYTGVVSIALSAKWSISHAMEPGGLGSLTNGSPCSCAATALLPASLAIGVGAFVAMSRITFKGVFLALFNIYGKMKCSKHALR